ncbi:MAG TPA: cbb3-type cytochrome c oxidase subunit I [Verrucomicrobiae bacterium]|nr:cbb3-type cytochrome c oxidase subunit I [Verrucomicrobiae bacterium]
MTATPTAPQPAATSAPLDIDASCRAPLLALFLSAALWLVLGTACTLLASIKLHVPHLLADCSALTYGRIRPAGLDCFLYGFGLQAGLGVGLWLLCRLGRTALLGSGVALFGMAFWNLGVSLGILGILIGDSTGYPAFELPRYAAGFLFFGYILLAIPAVMTFHARRPGLLYPSQWFVLGSIFWFSWIFSTAGMLLLCSPVRGVVQSSVSWWYANNLSEIVLGFMGLASIFYFIPKLVGRPLHSAPWAAFVFWMMTLFGSWAGLPEGSPLPIWVGSMSTVGTVLMVVAVLAVALNFYHTVRLNVNTLDADPTLRFCYVALIFWLIASAQQIIGALRGVNALTGLTWFGVAQKELQYYGFFALGMFGAIYYILPRLLQSTWCPHLLKAHFWLSLLGIVTLYLSHVIGGVMQGILLSEARNSFIDVLRSTMMAVRIGTLGELLIFVGALVFLLNFVKILSETGQRLRGDIMGRLS